MQPAKLNQHVNLLSWSAGGGALGTPFSSSSSTFCLRATSLVRTDESLLIDGYDTRDGVFDTAYEAREDGAELAIGLLCEWIETAMEELSEIWLKGRLLPLAGLEIL